VLCLPNVGTMLVRKSGKGPRGTTSGRDRDGGQRTKDLGGSNGLSRMVWNLKGRESVIRYTKELE